MSYPPQSGGPGDVQAVNFNCKLCLGLVPSWDGHDGDCPLHPSNRAKEERRAEFWLNAKLLRAENERDAAVKEVERLRGLLAEILDRFVQIGHRDEADRLLARMATTP